MWFSLYIQFTERYFQIWPKKFSTNLYAVNLWLKAISATGTGPWGYHTHTPAGGPGPAHTHSVTLSVYEYEYDYEYEQVKLESETNGTHLLLFLMRFQ